jgi:hypothetical protein
LPVIVITAFLMTHPNQISDELVDRHTYDEIFAHQATTISKIHHSSVRMWSSVIAVLLDGILDYSFGGVSEPITACKLARFSSYSLLSHDYFCLPQVA